LTGRRIREIANSRPFDVVHFHNISLLGPGVLKLTPAGSHFVKLYTTHEHWLVCPMHVLWKFNSRVCEKPECLRCTLQGRRPPQLWRKTSYLRAAAAHVDQFVSPSRFTARMHAERGFSEPVDHLPYFLARQDQDWKNPGERPQERPYFLFVGRLERLKGLHTLIEAWANVKNWDLLVAGTGTAEMDLRAQASSNPRIRFLGVQSQRQLGALYTHAVATIVPSVTYESFGMVLIESFARKTPVIVRDLGALPEVVEDSGGGAIYRENGELLRAAESLAQSPSLRRELGEEGYRAFISLWSTEAHFEQYFGFINSARSRKYGSKDEWQLTSSPAVQASSART
jgi:glycosyltransferase involved in cell wall biosynthesis